MSKMSKKWVVLAVVMALAFGMTACKKTTSEKVSDAAEAVGSDAKEAVQDAGEAVDDAAKATGKAVEDATK
jgi:hypothetical protein